MNQGKRAIGIIILCFLFVITGSVLGENQTSEGFGTYSITSDPTGADVIIQGKQIGVTPLLFIPDSTITAPFSIVISKPGYYDAFRNFTEMIPKGNQKKVSITLIELPKFGKITVAGNPVGCQANLNGNNLVPLPYTFPSVPTGLHTITVSKTGYKSYINPEVVVKPNEEISLQVTLIPNYERKELVITTSPPGSDIMVDGIYRGATMTDIALLIGPLNDGSHTVLARLSGYQDNTVTIKTRQDLSTNLELTMVSITAAPKSAGLRIKTIPSGANVLLNGIWVGEVPEKGHLTLSDVPPNRFKVLLNLTGYQDYSDWVFPGEGEIITIEQKLIQKN